MVLVMTQTQGLSQPATVAKLLEPWSKDLKPDLYVCTADSLPSSSVAQRQLEIFGYSYLDLTF